MKTLIGWFKEPDFWRGVVQNLVVAVLVAIGAVIFALVGGYISKPQIAINVVASIVMFGIIVWWTFWLMPQGLRLHRRAAISTPMLLASMVGYVSLVFSSTVTQYLFYRTLF